MRIKKLNSIAMKLLAEDKSVNHKLTFTEDTQQQINKATIDIANLNNKLNSIANLFGIIFNEDGSINTESYTSHKHQYIDKYIDDTADGSGTLHEDTVSTTGVE